MKQKTPIRIPRGHSSGRAKRTSANPTGAPQLPRLTPREYALAQAIAAVIQHSRSTAALPQPEPMPV